ncbi:MULTISPECIES: hypothetical protein [Bacillaceae]|uniref:Uncharacterized protein n=1 Tax=Evansella alkalicola TaxID=745819 RepID=A0ABS6JSM6_9BACI|nr:MULTISPECIES: hypothetical protein [Bacillaceae]MBU9720267.1 hypothetical protein [Bacillus alkalicola]
MKLRIFIDIIQVMLEEVKECWGDFKRANTKTEKSLFISLAYMNILFLIVYVIPMLSSLIIIGSSFVSGPLALIALLFTIPFMALVIAARLKLYPIVKQNYLKKVRST